MKLLPVAAIAVLAGCVAGLSAAVVWIMLGIPSRVTDIFDFRSAKVCGWALLAGAVLGSLLPLGGLSAHLGQAFGMAAMLLGGCMTGMLSSALTEVLNVLPQFLYRLRLTEAASIICWAMAAGKAAGAFVASYWSLW